MMIRAWSALLSALNPLRKRHGRGPTGERRPRSGARLALEALEDRLVPSISGTGYYGMGYDSGQGLTPPDTVAAAGPNHVVEAVNTNLFIASKASLPGSLSGSVQSFSSFFPGFTHSSFGLDVVTDPSVNYDAATGKWIISILDIDLQGRKGYLNVAVSNTSDPTGGWTKFQLNLTDGHGPLIAGNRGLTLWGDFERFGSSANAYVWTVNMFSFSSGGIDQNSLYDHVQVIAIDKSNLSSVHTVDLPSWDATGGTITNENLLPARMDAPTAADGMWFAEETNYGTTSGQANALRLVHVANMLTATPADFANFTGSVPLYQFTFLPDGAQGGNHPWNNGDTTTSAPQKGSTDLIETNDTRINSAVWRTVNGQQHLVLTQTVGSTADPGVTKARWYDFNTTGATNPAVAVPLYQSGEVNPGSGVFTYFPSAAIDPAGDIGMTYLESSPGEYLSMYVTGKRLADSGMQPAVLVVGGNSADTGPDGSPHRAGDYSGTVVDVTSGGAAANAFWSANEYANGGFWGTALESYTVGSPPPATDLAVTVSGPSSVTTGTNATYTITITNNGPNPAQGVVLSDTLPAGSTFVSMTRTAGTDAFTLSQSGGSASETATGTLAAGSSDTFSLVVFASYNLSNGASFNDTATVSAANPDSNPANNSATASGSVIAAPPPAQFYDGGFEIPSVGSGASAYVYDPTASPWSFVGQAGVSGNGSGFTSGNPSAPQGAQVAFLQNAGSFSQQLTLAAGTYAVTFSAAQRATFQSSTQTFQVRVDGTVVGTFTPSGTAYATYATGVFAVSAGVHTVAFVGLNPNGGDNTAFLDQAAVNAAAPPPAQLQDGGFETPPVGSGASAYVYDPASSPWSFAGQAGVSGNGSGFTSGNPSAPQGAQVAFLQNAGSFSQQVTLSAGTYVVTFSAAQRATYQSSSQTFNVLIDGVAVAKFTPTGTAYTTYTTGVFAVAAGIHTVAFTGLNPNAGDNTAFIDQAAVNAAPAPPSQLQDGGFETPSVGSGPSAYQYDPAASPWSFVGQAGVSGNASGFTSGNPGAPQGAQVAFLQNSGSFSQQLTLSAGAYVVTFSAAQRAAFQSSTQTFNVLIDGVAVRTFTPSGTSYASYTTGAFTVATGIHTLAFVGLNPNGGDNTVFLDQVTLTSATPPASLQDSGFEIPSVGSGASAYVYDPASSPWSFAGQAGVSGNGSGFTSGNPSAPQGAQVAFLQNSGSFSQAVTLAAGTYVVSFSAAQRATFQSSAQTFQVRIDGTVVGTFTPSGTAYAAYTSSTFTVAAGVHTVAFVGLNPNGGDNTAFLDQVAITSPPPGFLLYGSPITQITRGHGGSGRGHSGAAEREHERDEDAAVRKFKPSGASHATYIPGGFADAAGIHALAFAGLNPSGGDHDTFLNQAAASSPLPDALRSRPAIWEKILGHAGSARSWLGAVDLDADPGTGE